MKAYSLNFSTYPILSCSCCSAFLSNKSQEQNFVLHNKCCLACGSVWQGRQEAVRCKVLGVSWSNPLEVWTSHLYINTNIHGWRGCQQVYYGDQRWHSPHTAHRDLWILWSPALVINGCPLPETGGNINPSILLGTLSGVNWQDLGGEIFPSDCCLPAAVLLLETVTELCP